MAVSDIGAFEYVDADEDGWPAGSDCQDMDPSINPGAVDWPGDSGDENCDGRVVCDPERGWPNHGSFVQCFVRECKALIDQGRAAPSECFRLISGGR